MDFHFQHLGYKPMNNLNSAPRTEADVASNVTASFQFTPAASGTWNGFSQQKFDGLLQDIVESSFAVISTPTASDPTMKMKNKQVLPLPTFVTDESSIHERERQENLIPSSIWNELSQQKFDGLLQDIVQSSFTVIPTQIEEKMVSDRGSDHRGMNRNMTPQPKPDRQRKYRPKVIAEGTVGKRKYVGRKGLKASATQEVDCMKEADPNAETSDPNSRRRLLNFDLANGGHEKRAKIVNQKDMLVLEGSNTYECQVTRWLKNREDNGCEANLTMQPRVQNGLAMENRQSRNKVMSERQQVHNLDPAIENFNHLRPTTPEKAPMPGMLQEQKEPPYENQRSTKARGSSSAEPVYPIITADEMTDEVKGRSSLNKRNSKAKGEERNAIVLYEKGASKVVPHKGFLPKVDLDGETIRTWNLLTGKKGRKDAEGTDDEKEKWLEEERRVFKGRVDAFIARMRLIQGDRSFSRWKGSVVDSIVGVFLTQNVSDKLSSSAFMTLAAKFPLKASCQTESEEDGTKLLIEEQKVSELNPNDSINTTLESGLINEGLVQPKGKEPMNSNSTENGTDSTLKPKGRKAGKMKRSEADWESLRKQVLANGVNKERSKETMDSMDYEAMRQADVTEIADAIEKRGFKNLLAGRIKEFLDQLVRVHGSIDLEWLRDLNPDDVKEYLEDIYGLGSKSVECVRLLAFHHHAFPVDTNVRRIAVRLGWVFLQPLPESMQLHLLQSYPVLESIQKYLWPRLCKLDQETLYELHYHLITFGKVFCTKKQPKCNDCPMRGECRHFASACASARIALPRPEDMSITTSMAPTMAQRNPAGVFNPIPLAPPENNSFKVWANNGNIEPIIEEPVTPEPEPEESQSDIEDAVYEDPDEIPTIELNIEECMENPEHHMQENMEVQESNMSKALVALNPAAASVPAPKLKNVSQLRTEHYVYELPDTHPLLHGMDRRETDDPCPYLFAIWAPGETADSIQQPEQSCGCEEPGKSTLACNNVGEDDEQKVSGTILIPCRTALRGSFPLNGTYFQVNEVFADDETSINPRAIPRKWIWNLPRRTVYFGTSVSTICKGLSIEEIQQCFWKGFICVRGFDRKSRAPRPLKARLHFPASKLPKTKD